MCPFLSVGRNQAQGLDVFLFVGFEHEEAVFVRCSSVLPVGIDLYVSRFGAGRAGFDHQDEASFILLQFEPAGLLPGCTSVGRLALESGEGGEGCVCYGGGKCEFPVSDLYALGSDAECL